MTEELRELKKQCKVVALVKQTAVLYNLAAVKVSTGLIDKLFLLLHEGIVLNHPELTFRVKVRCDDNIRMFETRIIFLCMVVDCSTQLGEGQALYFGKDFNIRASTPHPASSLVNAPRWSKFPA